MPKGLARSIGRGSALDAPVRKLRLSLDVAMSFTGSTGVAVEATTPISDFPAGNVLVLGAVANLTFTGPTSANLVDTFEGDFGIGSTPAADNTISGADVDIIPSTAIAIAAAEVSSNNRGVLAAPVTLDNTDGSLEINLNVLMDADEVTNAQTVAITVTGTVDIVYSMLGDD